VKRMELRLAETGNRSRVLVDGEPFPDVRRVEIDCAMNEPTAITLHLLNRASPEEPLVLRGYFVPENSAIVPYLLELANLPKREQS
jgi:hypothetical protein